MSKNFNEEKLKINKTLQKLVVQHRRLIFEKMFVEKYVPLLKQSVPWLAGKPNKEINSLMEEYVSDFEKAFGKKPDWYIDDLKIPKRDAQRVNIDTFKVVIRMERKRFQ